MRAPAGVAHGLSCSMVCGIFLDQGSNPWPLYWQADSYPRYCQGSPLLFFSALRKEMVSPSPNSIVCISCFLFQKEKTMQITKMISRRSFLHLDNCARMELSADRPTPAQSLKRLPRMLATWAPGRYGDSSGRPRKTSLMCPRNKELSLKPSDVTLDFQCISESAAGAPSHPPTHSSVQGPLEQQALLSASLCQAQTPCK